METPKTHFEQISVETVKKIATEFPENNTVGNDSESIKAPSKITSPQEGWREVAQKVQIEQDPQKMLGLIQQLIATFDEEQVSKRLPTRDTRNQSGSSAT